MNPKNAREIVDGINDGVNRSLRKEVKLTEFTDGGRIIHYDKGQIGPDEPNETPGDHISISTPYTIDTELNVLAKLGYLVSTKPEFVDPQMTNPMLELKSQGDTNVYIDHNPTL